MDSGHAQPRRAGRRPGRAPRHRRVGRAAVDPRRRRPVRGPRHRPGRGHDRRGRLRPAPPAARVRRVPRHHPDRRQPEADRPQLERGARLPQGRRRDGPAVPGRGPAAGRVEVRHRADRREHRLRPGHVRRRPAGAAHRLAADLRAVRQGGADRPGRRPAAPGRDGLRRRGGAGGAGRDEGRVGPAGRRGRQAVRLPPLQGVHVPAGAERPGPGVRAGAPPVQRQPAAGAGARDRVAAVAGGHALPARVHPLVEREVPPPGGHDHRRLPAAAPDPAAVGVRGADELPRVGARGPVRAVDAGGGPRRAGADGRPDGVVPRAEVAAAGGHRECVVPALRLARGVAVVAAVGRLLRRGDAHLAGGRRHHPPEDEGGEVARRLLPRLLRRGGRPAGGEGVHARRPDGGAERRGAARLEGALRPAGRPAERGPAAGGDHRGRVEADLLREAVDDVRGGRGGRQGAQPDAVGRDAGRE